MSIKSAKLACLGESALANQTIYYKGSLKLLERPKVAIVGSRKPTAYAKRYTHEIAVALANVGAVVVSGGAIGVDAIAHKAAGSENTVMVAATGLDVRYPAINDALIRSIESKGLVLSQFAPDTPSYRYNFPIRNELIVALASVLVVTYADKNSGSAHSIEYAKRMGKAIYVLPHRLGESEATNELLAQQRAEAIFDIEAFAARFGTQKTQNGVETDEILAFCRNHPTYEEALRRFGQKLFEYELSGKIVVKEGRVFRG